MKAMKIIINDDGELQAIYVPKEIGKIRVSVIDYYENENKAEKAWEKLEEQEANGEMIAVY